MGWVADLPSPTKTLAYRPGGRGLGAQDRESEITRGSRNRGCPDSARSRGGSSAGGPRAWRGTTQAALSPPRSPGRSRRADAGSAGFVGPSQAERVSAARADPWELAPGAGWTGHPRVWRLHLCGGPRAQVVMEASSGAGSDQQGGPPLLRG